MLVLGVTVEQYYYHYYYYCVYLFIWRPTVAQHLCASAGKKTGFRALRKCKSDASDASDASYIQSQCVCGGVWGGGVIRCIGRIGF